MKRNLIYSLLQGYNPKAQSEIIAKQRMQTFAETYEDCFERSLVVGHFTASAWLLSKDGTHALLTHHAKLDMWLQLGGHCDGDSDVRAVALREALEESGISHIEFVHQELFDIDIHTIPEHKGVPAHEHYDVRFLLRVMSDEQPIKSSESKELYWLSKEDEEMMLGMPSLHRMIQKWRLL